MRLKHSEYMPWAKLHSDARFNLATSGVAGFPLSELPVSIEQLQINGDSAYGYEPLQQAIAEQMRSRSRVRGRRCGNFHGESSGHGRTP